MDSPPGGLVPHAQQVTPRERELLRLVRQGLMNSEIAALLQISTRTVESHVASLMRKFGVHRRRMLIDQLLPSPLVDTASDVSRRRSPVNTAELDRDGVIVAVNTSWQRYCADNHGDLSRCGAGSSYLRMCETAGDRHSATIAAYIRIATRGGTFVPLQTRIPCHSPTQRRYYDVLVSSRVDDDGVCVGATVSLSRAHRARAAQPVS